MVAAAVIGGSALTAGVGALTSSSASNKQANAARDAASLQYEQYLQTRRDLQPYNQGGQQAFGQLQNLLGLNQQGRPGGNTEQMLQTLQNLPGYQFALGQGLKSTQNSFAARGLGSSGAAMRGAADYATGLAQSNYGNYFNQLLGTAQLGQNAAAGLGNIGSGLAQGGGNALIAGGNAQAAGILGIGNSINNAVGQIGGLYATNALLQQQGYPGFFGGGGAGTPQVPFGYSSSDRRLKTNIKFERLLRNGLGWYSYVFKDKPDEPREGVMADEVEKIMPEAVMADANGFKFVNYDEVLRHA